MARLILKDFIDLMGCQIKYRNPWNKAHLKRVQSEDHWLTNGFFFGSKMIVVEYGGILYVRKI